MLLGVNVDHVATLRQARGTVYPDPVDAALIAQQAGADSITVHLREDRRHILDHDVTRLMQQLRIPLNLEMAATEEMIAIACEAQPDYCCLVPEKREELTTEGGLDVAGNSAAVAAACTRLDEAGVRTSLFIDPDKLQIDAAIAAGARVIEIHTGAYADASVAADQESELTRVREAATYADDHGLVVNAGHGLNYVNVEPVAAIKEIIELNIGHAIVARSVFDGITEAVQDMKRLMLEARE